MTVYKFGAQWAMQPDLTLRAGYSYGKQPVPRDGVLFNVLAPALIEHHFTLGLTKAINKNSEINISAMYAPRKTSIVVVNCPFLAALNQSTSPWIKWNWNSVLV
ncbi:hypothetical protein [Chromatium okenii]|uniref:hypothetical protein n=1 Tax=Chromatium okenii TaxID=61644 RepID=UPI0024136F5A|nr:hypothetical protein [Chromatium okenii]